MRTSIEKDAGFELGDLEGLGFFIAIAEDILDRRPPECLVGREPVFQLGQTPTEPGAIAHGEPVFPVLPGFDQLDRSVGVPIIVTSPQFNVRRSDYRRL